MRTALFALVLAAALSVGCHGNPTTPSNQLPLTTTLHVGQEVSVSGLSATFVAVTGDSRCPLNAFCVWAGEAALQFELSANHRAARYDLKVGASNPNPPPTTHEGFAIEVQSLQPYPSDSRSIPQEDYRATVKISRSPR